MAQRNMNLAHTDNSKRFVAMLEKCEAWGYGKVALTPWEARFISDMRNNFDARETQADLGMTPWSPTMNQWNTLHGIASKL